MLLLGRGFFGTGDFEAGHFDFEAGHFEACNFEADHGPENLITSPIWGPEDIKTTLHTFPLPIPMDSLERGRGKGRGSEKAGRGTGRTRWQKIEG